MHKKLTIEQMQQLANKDADLKSSSSVVCTKDTHKNKPGTKGKNLKFFNSINCNDMFKNLFWAKVKLSKCELLKL